jgi:hypothetical protein
VSLIETEQKDAVFFNKATNKSEREGKFLPYSGTRKKTEQMGLNFLNSFQHNIEIRVF